MTEQRLILASGSKARSEMLSSAGVSHDVDVARIDEQLIKESMSQEDHPPRDIADALAQSKASKIARRQPGRLVLGADQILVHGGKIYDKPKDLDEAREQILALKGEAHRLISACVMMIDDKVTFRHIDIAKLVVREFSEEFLQDYLKEEGDQILSCVGSYRLEARGAQLFSTISGDYFTILGLPLLPCLQHLRDQGMLKT